MNATVLYSLQTIISAGVFILIYRLFVRNTNAYNWNRFYLLATMIISLFLPRIDISGWFNVEKPIIFYGSLIDFNQAVTITPGQQVQNPFNLSELIMTGYWIVAILLLLRFSWGIMRIIELAKNDDYKKSGNLRLYPIQRKTTFSFFNYIFIQPEHWDKPVTDFIIRHERAHVKQMHSLDNLLTEIILVFGWFNPFYYVYRRDLHLLHECQADQVVINSGCDKSTYHQLLLNEVSGNLTYIIVNQFSYSLIKRRFKMISKNKQSRLAGFRILLAIPTAFALLLLFSFTNLDKTTSLLKTKVLQPTNTTLAKSFDNVQPPQLEPKTPQKKPTELKDKPLLKVEKNPEFKGGFEAMQKFLRNNIHYPETAKTAGVQGTVFVQFVVTKTGAITNVKILRGIGNGCDEEAIRVVKAMQDWTPGENDGKTVSVMFQIPVKFQLGTSSYIVKTNPKNEVIKPMVDSNGDPTYMTVEQNPEFQGGYEGMQKFLRDKITYPTLAQKSGIQGTVFVQFIIEKTGEISNIKILRGIGGGCDEEAMRVVKEMPKWIPGRQNGEAVSVMFQIPVKFQLAMKK
jgi:TonB family protein